MATNRAHIDGRPAGRARSLTLAMNLFPAPASRSSTDASAQQVPRPPSGLRRLWRRLWRFDRHTVARRRAAERLYSALVSQARTPALFGTLGVPDTPEGRFEALALHAALVIRRLRFAGPAGQALGQELFDLMFIDVDVNLRELGVGDLSVGKYVKRLARNFYARLAVLDAALAGADGDAVVPMLEANVYRGGQPPSEVQLAALADYLWATAAALEAQDVDRLLAGEVSFVQPRLQLKAAAPI